MKIIKFIKNEKVFSLIFFFALLSLLRSLVVPLQGDENTYLKIAENILKGKYYLEEHPSTVTPIIPFTLAFFKINTYPLLGFALNKLFNIFISFIGFRYIYLFFKDQITDKRVIFAILSLTISTSISISYLSSLYPEAILLMSFWGFLYYFNKPISLHNFKRVFLFFLLLVITRYVYAVFGLIILFYYYQTLKENNLELKTILTYTFILSLPLFFWFKYVYFIEASNLSEVSYFSRFKSEQNPFIYNIKCGLGLIKHHEVDRINGIPAFISLFVPVTGLRNYFISIILIFSIIYGYYKNLKTQKITLLFWCILLTMIGFIFAGTGFSRYWLILLPGFYYGFYLLFLKINKNTIYFIYISKLISILYIINELRLDYLILKKYL